MIFLSLAMYFGLVRCKNALHCFSVHPSAYPSHFWGFHTFVHKALFRLISNLVDTFIMRLDKPVRGLTSKLLGALTMRLCRHDFQSCLCFLVSNWSSRGGWGCEVSCGGHHRPRGKTTTGSALDGAVFDITQILAYLVHNMSRSQLYLGFGHFGWLPSFFGQ